MSGKSDKNRPSSRFSPYPRDASSAISRSPLASPSTSRRHSPLPGNSTAWLDVPAHQAGIYLSPETASRHPSSSWTYAHPTANSASTSTYPPPSQVRPIHHFEAAAYQSSSTHLTTPAPLLPQGQASAYQGSNYAAGTLRGAHSFIMNDPVFVENNAMADNFMKELWQETIIGAEFDSSDRHPPPRCHPGTRLAIIQRCLDFIIRCQDEGKLRWVVGPAGVGKSAIMQMVTEKAPNGVIFASIFLSINGRADGSKVILTIAYQLAVKCGPYRQFIRDQITLNPSLVRKSLPVQFNKFIVEPFIHQRLFEPLRQFLITIDGLDECDNPSTQKELLGLIAYFCITYPTSPIAWIVASRPEPHITSFFERDEVKRAYTKEEIKVDSYEACEDVQKYLRDELKKIKLEYPTLKHKREWPLEHEFTEIASSAGGLFAYAATVIRYIGNPHCRDPAAQLRRILAVIHMDMKDHMSEHPMARLDGLYKRILSSIPHDVMINTRNLLLMTSSYNWQEGKFRMLCNTLDLTEDEAYGAIRHLYAVMKIPDPDKADDEDLEYYHKSFEDFLSDFNRSGFSSNFEDEAGQLIVQISLRIFEEVPYDSDAVAGGRDIYIGDCGDVKGRCDNVSLSWPYDERFRMTDERLRIKLYVMINFLVCNRLDSDRSSPWNISFTFHVLTTHFSVLGSSFPIFLVQTSAFDTFRDELIELGKLKQVPLRAFNYVAVFGFIQLQFTSPIETNIDISDPWNSSCGHERKEIDDLQQRRGWSTLFGRYYTFDRVIEDGEDDKDDKDAEDGEDADIPRFHILKPQKRHRLLDYATDVECLRCSRRLARHLMNNPDQLAAVFIDGTQMSYVELSFVDPDDGVSEWRYRFFHSGPPTGIDT